MKDTNWLLWAGIGFTSFGVTQLLSFIRFSYPAWSDGATIVLALILLCITSLGLINTIGLMTKGHMHSRRVWWMGMAPSIVLAGFFFLAVIAGFRVALGG